MGKRKRRPSKKPAAVTKLTGVERVLSLDPSSRCCGWALFDAGLLAAYGKFVQQGEGHGERLTNFRVWLLDTLKTLQPDVLIYEAPYSGRMRNTFGILSRYAGQIEAAYFEWGGHEIEDGNAFPAHLVKKIMGAKKGTHETNKKNMVLLINRLYGLSLKFKANDPRKAHSQDDEADAIAVNHAWHELHRSQESADDE